MTQFIAEALSLELEAMYQEQPGQKAVKQKAEDWLDPEAGLTGIVEDPKDLYGVSSNTMLAIKRAADYLEKHYSGWDWVIQPDMRGGIVNLFSGRLSAQFGWILRIQELEQDYNNTMVKKAAGELLERFGMPRKPYHMCISEHKKASRDAYGQVIPEITAMKGAITKAMRIQQGIRQNKGVEVKFGGASFMRIAE